MAYFEAYWPLMWNESWTCDTLANGNKGLSVVNSMFSIHMGPAPGTVLAPENEEQFSRDLPTL